MEKYENLTGEDLGHRPSTLEKTRFEYFPLGILFRKAFEKDKAKSGVKSNSDFNYNNNHSFYRFHKGYDKFAEMSLDSKYNRVKEFKKFLNNFENPGPKKTETKLKKE